MKQVISKIAITLCSFMLVMESCSKTNDAVNTQAAVDPGTTATSGTWTVSSYSQRAEDKTSQLNGYVFTFLPGGVLKAQLETAVTNGTWVYTPAAVTYYGSTGSKSSFTFNLGTAKPLSLLSKTWNIDSVRTTSSTLALVNPEVAEGELLTFSKMK